MSAMGSMYLTYKAEKVGGVALFDKDILATVAPVVYVIVLAILEWDQVVHGRALPFRPGRFTQTCQVLETWQVFARSLAQGCGDGFPELA